ncbi:MAG: hypothetical protein NUV67_05495 [archaeon]|nr:hypothetical protein [archaeon]
MPKKRFTPDFRGRKRDFFVHETSHHAIEAERDKNSTVSQSGAELLEKSFANLRERITLRENGVQVIPLTELRTKSPKALPIEVLNFARVGIIKATAERNLSPAVRSHLEAILNTLVAEDCRRVVNAIKADPKKVGDRTLETTISETVLALQRGGFKPEVEENLQKHMEILIAQFESRGLGK